jgi:hypothetical protein
MAYELREGQGSMFPNRKKEPGSKQPDWRGDALVNGVVMEVAGWSKEGAKGSFLSLSIKPKQERKDDAPTGGGQPRQYADDRITSGPAPRRTENMDDDIPFLPERR